MEEKLKLSKAKIMTQILVAFFSNHNWDQQLTVSELVAKWEIT